MRVVRALILKQRQQDIFLQPKQKARTRNETDIKTN
jgi:hypothetical protein